VVIRRGSIGNRGPEGGRRRRWGAERAAAAAVRSRRSIYSKGGVGIFVGEVAGDAREALPVDRNGAPH
jgi:hypothetical protein